MQQCRKRSAISPTREHVWQYDSPPQFVPPTPQSKTCDWAIAPNSVFYWSSFVLVFRLLWRLFRLPGHGETPFCARFSYCVVLSVVTALRRRVNLIFKLWNKTIVNSNFTVWGTECHNMRPHCFFSNINDGVLVGWIFGHSCLKQGCVQGERECGQCSDTKFRISNFHQIYKRILTLTRLCKHVVMQD